MEREPDARVLQVWDRLEVGPVILEPRRLMAAYSVTRGGQTEVTDLVYKYPEPVFDPEDPASQNLAAVAAAQVALNYGLFCRELVFHGPYDRHDRRLLTEMARHTAREIYVNKLLQPNPFLVPGALDLPARRLGDFLLAQVRFEEHGPPPERLPRWDTDRRRHAVLSSGGKDSLLSYGLLHELGLEVHPLFVNESGRHWYTAINAYRHFQAEVPNTARVWTSADRVFSWMLRRLPFVRPDFARLRADIYPLRLWTVAVFIFGVLPLLRHRGIGRLIIGDEHDSTTRQSYRGITHHAGYYDQSRPFDNTLTRYFSRKGWDVSQFSLLRPMSELLIQQALVQRYPELQRHQVSCHATHLDGEHALPCGRCEKCRRIMVMLAALGADPTSCGYTEQQLARALEAFAATGLHQEAAALQQTAHMLLERGLLDHEMLNLEARERPEVLRLRFDARRSPPDTIPGDLREPLYRLLLEHATGASRRSGRVWLEVDPLSEMVLSPPYRFEGAAGTGSGGTADDAVVDGGYLWCELSWPQARRRLDQVDVALLPVGALEQHGPHLPLDVDAFDADRLCRDVAAACRRPRPLVLPLLPYGVSYHHDDFAGTVSISPDTLSRLVHEIGLSVSRQGVLKLVIINGHGGNEPALNFAAQMINRDAGIFTCVDTGETSDAEVEQLAETPNDAHAGEIETSTTLAFRPELVRMQRARRSVPRFSSEYLNFSSSKGVSWYARTAAMSESGVLGDPTRASRDKGRRIWEVMVRNLVALVEDLKGLTLDEIYQRRY